MDDLEDDDTKPLSVTLAVPRRVAVWALGAWAGWVAAESVVLGVLGVALVRDPPQAANFLPQLLPTVWPLLVVGRPLDFGLFVAGWALATVAVVSWQDHRGATWGDRKRAAVLASVAFAAVYGLGWPVVFFLNVGKG